MLNDPLATVSAAADRDLTTDTPQPRYQQVYARLADDIAHGTLRAGEQLPAERLLCEQLGVSRVTLRRALESLAHDGLIESSAGRGWFVAEGPITHASFVSFTSMGAARGLIASARVLYMAVHAATLDEAEALGIAPASDIFELERLRSLDGMVIAIDHSRVPLQRCPSLPDVDWSKASLYQVLEERSAIIASRCSYVVEAIPAEARYADLLELPLGAPLLVNEQTAYDQYERVIELGRITYRYDRFRFRAEQTRTSESGARGR